MSAALRCTALVVASVWAVAAAGCARAADEARLETDLQTRLDRDLAPGLFEVVALRREGSAPAPAGDSGAERVVGYFNATMRLARDYTFGAWDQLGPSSVAYALGATRSETIRQVVLRAALPGIVGGVLLAVSRAIGETMIVVMAAGLAANLTANPLAAVTTVTVQIVTLLTGDQEFDSPKTLAASGKPH